MATRKLSASQRRQLEDLARQARIMVMQMIARARSGHPSASLGVTDILIALYFSAMKVDAARPDWDERDRFILSNGHVCPALYAVLALKGFVPNDQLQTLRKPGSILQGHPHRHPAAGIDMTTGSLGQGFSVAAGMALAARVNKLDYRVYCLMGDGEMAEGQIWEAALFAAHQRLSNLVVLIDRNGVQTDGKTEQVLKLNPVKDKWRAFGWNALECDGHSMHQLHGLLGRAKSSKKPTAIVCRTQIGRGVSRLLGRTELYGAGVTPALLRTALRELGDGRR